VVEEQLPQGAFGLQKVAILNQFQSQVYVLYDHEDPATPTYPSKGSIPNLGKQECINVLLFIYMIMKM
jgi:hypothetical protein